MCTSGRGSCGSNGVLVAARAPTWSPVIFYVIPPNTIHREANPGSEEQVVLVLRQWAEYAQRG